MNGSEAPPGSSCAGAGPVAPQVPHRRRPVATRLPGPRFTPQIESRWGEVKGRLTVDLAVQSGEGLQQTTAEITFHAPVGFFIGFCTPPSTCASDARLSGSRGGVSLETVSPP